MRYTPKTAKRATDGKIFLVAAGPVRDLPERPCSHCGDPIPALPQYTNKKQFCSVDCHVGVTNARRQQKLDELAIFKQLLAAGEEPL